MDEQPTGTTEVSVAKEQVAEAQEDAADKRELNTLEKIMSLRPSM